MQIWRPEREHLEESNVARYMSSHRFKTLAEFISFTQDRPEEFWRSFDREILNLRWHEDLLERPGSSASSPRRCPPSTAAEAAT